MTQLFKNMLIEWYPDNPGYYVHYKTNLLRMGFGLITVWSERDGQYRERVY
jgi:hypothetical protein